MAKYMSYKIKTDTRQVKLKLSNLAKKNAKLRNMILGRLGEAIRRNIVMNKLSGQVLNRQSGTLANSIEWKIKGKGMEIGSNVVYAAIHEFGGIIEPRIARALHFKIGDRWVITQRVTIPKRPYIWPGITEVFNSGEAQRIGEKAEQEFINNNWGK